MVATFAVPGHIIDGMAPHVWQGSTATEDWYKDVLREGKEHGASGYSVTVREPLHNDITGDSAYIVLPATMTFDLKGTKVRQTGAVFTVALRKTADGWHVAAWAWGKAFDSTERTRPVEDRAYSFGTQGKGSQRSRT